jgi:thiol-disulfide isomerase/thioredoxin
MEYVRKIPGWLIMVAIFGVLYATGLHTQVIGQAQRLILATGLMKPDVPVSPDTKLEGSGSAGPGKNSLPAFPQADYDFSLKSLEGETITLESLQGKVIFMNFWATWCPPCIAEMPAIQNLYEKVKSDKIAFVMVSLDEDPAKASKFIQRMGFTFPVYSPDGYTPPVYGSGNVIPTTYVISPDGFIVARQEGMAQYDTKEFRNFLLKMAQTGKAP